MDLFLKYLIVFGVGGTICLLAQILIIRTRMTSARILVLFVTLGVILTGIGVYKPLVDFAGAGATVPLTGFGYSLAKGVMEEIDSEGPIGILTGGLTATSAGIAAAVFFGFIAALVSKPKMK